MRKPYLIQRMSKRNRDAVKIEEGTSFDGYLSLDYMGSAEFEFGALPASLKRLTKSIEKREIYTFEDIKNYENKKLVIIASSEAEANKYKEFIIELMKSEYGIRLKERTDVFFHNTDEFLKEKGVNLEGGYFKYRRDTDSWWDIENDIIFCFGKDYARNIFKAIINTREKKKRDKAEGWY